jgi:hypothetical protein
MLVTSLSAIERAVRRSWSRDTCDPVDLPTWSPENPARGQCGVTAVVLHELLGGHVLVATVDHADGSRQGMHYWNLLSCGLQIDLTREQFTAGERVGEPESVQIPAGQSGRLQTQQSLLRQRVYDVLGLATSRTPLVACAGMPRQPAETLP